MLGPDILKEAPLQIESIMRNLQDYTIKEIARLITKHGKITSSAEHLLTTMTEQDIFNRDFKKLLAKSLGVSERKINDLFVEAAKSNYIYDKRVFEEAGITFIPFEDNIFMQSLVKNVIDNSFGDIQNFTRSLGFAKRINGKLIFQPISQFYQNELDLALMKVATGTTTFEKAVGDAIKTMADSGLRTIDYASGAKHRIDIAARRAVMGGMRDLTNNQSDYNASLMKITTFEISWHSGHRPSHRWGGRRFDTTGQHYPTEQSLYEKYPAPNGDVGTLYDYNCYHEKYAVFPDSLAKFTEKELNELEAKELLEIEHRGKRYNQYQARQRQRYLERVIRRQQSLIAGYEGALPETTDALRNAKIMMRQLRKEYLEFCGVVGFSPEFERINTGFIL